MIKKLSSKREEQRKQKRMQYIMGIVLVFIMLFSTFGIVANSFGGGGTEQTIEYKGYEFTQENSYYVLNIGDLTFYFLTNPKNLDDIQADILISKDLTDYVLEPLYVSIEDPQLNQEISKNFLPYAQRIQQACLEGIECQFESYPIQNCSENFIIIKQGLENKVYEEENCIFIEGKQEDLLTLTDKVILEIIGIK